MGPLSDVSFQTLIQTLDLSSSFRDAPHFTNATLDCDEEKSILEKHPAGMFDPAPLARSDYAVNGLRPENPAEKMIGGDYDRRREQNAPVAIEKRGMPGNQIRGNAFRCGHQ